MLAYELHLSVALVVGALLSTIIFFLSQPKRIQLESDYEPLEGEDPYDADLQGRDMFDIAKPEDMVDGFPINEAEFWAKIRVRKAVANLVLSLLVGVNAGSVGWLIVTDEGSKPAVASAVLRLVFSLYLLVLCVLSLSQSTIETHWPTTIHLSALTTFAFSIFGASALLPVDSLASAVRSDAASSLTLTSIALLFVAAIITSTMPRGPPVYFPAEKIYSPKTLQSSTFARKDNVCGIVQSSVIDFLLFSYTTPIVLLGYTAESLDIADLPIVPLDMRAVTIFTRMRHAMKTIKLRGRWASKPGTGWTLMWRLIRVNGRGFLIQTTLAAVSAILYYVPAFFLQRLVHYLEENPNREDMSWGWVYCAGLLFGNAINYIITGQLWSISTTTLQVGIRVELNTILFAKTLVRKDVASSSATAPPTPDATRAPSVAGSEHADEKSDEDDFSSKAQIMTLMTTDVDRVSEFGWHIFSLVDAPIEIIIGSIFLYKLLGVSCFFGLTVTCLFLPLNHWASKFVISAQDNLMKSRDERVSLMNEILGGMRMLKFMAWERNFEARVLKIRDRELYFQKRNYLIETFFNAIWNASPVLVTLVSFFHFAVIRGEDLTPSIAFTSLAVFNELKFALNALPETFINMLQSLVSVRRIEKYLYSAEISPNLPTDGPGEMRVVLSSATVTWPQDRIASSIASSAASTPKHKFVLVDLNLEFPIGELSLICGKLGSGKTLLLLALLGEADLLSGGLICPRSPPDALARFAELSHIPEDEWVVPGICAYVPQTAWLQNASIKDNILFHLPYDERRYQKTLEVCALVSDLKILEDGDDSEIGERGVNLSGGQKARVSLARAVYSRASILLLDDVLSAVDAHTAHHIYNECLKGPLLAGRTVILVSHHVQLCAAGASYIVALDNGRLEYAGNSDDFVASGIMGGLVREVVEEKKEPVAQEEPTIEEKIDPATPTDEEIKPVSQASRSTTMVNGGEAPSAKKAPRKLVEEERRAVGRIGREIWLTYIKANGGIVFWVLFALVLVLGTLSPVVENGWLRYWSGAVDKGDTSRSQLFYIEIYALVSLFGLIVQTLRWIIIYQGSINASHTLHKKMLEAVLFANIRFHDTISRGRLLNRFGKDFEGIDSGLADNFGRTVMYGLSVITSFITVSYVGGPWFLAAAVILGVLYYNVAKVYGQTSRDMRRLDSTTRSPLYTTYSETIAGVGVLRSYGASTKFLREMQQHVDTNTNPYYWMWSVSTSAEWLSARFNLLSSVVVGVTGVIVLVNRSVDASFAGFALAFASTVTNDLLFMVRRFVGLEQSMVALERVHEFSNIAQEPPEFIEPRPPASWPHEGSIEVENLVIRYAPDLPNVLHNLNFSVKPRSKIGVLGRTGGGKSTLALSFFRFVEATEGKIVIDGVDIAKIGLADLRSRLTIIPQDPTILSGTLRSTLDVFNDYEDREIFEALRRVHLIPQDDEVAPESMVNANVFRNLDSPVSEGGDNFSAGEKQLICMARAILKRSKVLFMDEATASVDYATDELISKTIRKEFAESTILTIAHRLRTVIDYDKVIILDKGRIAEFDRPSVLLADPSSMFYSLCKSTGPTEFAVLQKMATEAEERAQAGPPEPVADSADPPVGYHIE
ncbi:hypothetical protein BOTBODRAFT_26106 [Botryobasidium botryosum FD-172 SS1]|uniref:Multidrug resistance-associated ABC transporter n=1 Tax=Botryobasidium botryosum (strain FD-172 SS1) TaxID=930990 RepID=A0A067N1E3_BOTB1|nr:hypothetical protein BOTBODRAFT_26106 [Botryobasidium botryosum FD-172 SS1]